MATVVFLPPPYASSRAWTRLVSRIEEHLRLSGLAVGMADVGGRHRAPHRRVFADLGDGEATAGVARKHKWAVDFIEYRPKERCVVKIRRR